VGEDVVTGPALRQKLTEKVGHRWSHSRLLLQPALSASADPPAIVVPTIRPPAAVREALLLGRTLNCLVVVLCSGWSSAVEVTKLARSVGTHVVAVDVTKQSGLPVFTSDVLLASRRRQGLDRTNDVSLKRNLGIAAARMRRWSGLVFLDDDITDLDPAAVRSAFGLLGAHNVAALQNVGYPDNSAVCHARREVGLNQDTFVGGGAMAIRTRPQTPFFPTIYNEDWLFLVGRRGIERVAVCGKVSQHEYDPFLTPERARSEEFGDVLAEGLFALSEKEQRILPAADEKYWRAFLDDRITMIDEILSLLRERRATDKGHRMIQALTMAQGRCRVITPEFCVSYLRAWQADQETWKSFLAGLPAVATVAEAFRSLGLEVREHRPRE
jgi:hypothetical protein